MGLVSLAWSLVLLLPRAAAAGVGTAASEAWHALLIQYLPFATLLLALYTAVGGVHAARRAGRDAAGNTVLLAMGVGPVVGTTAAAVVCRRFSTTHRLTWCSSTSPASGRRR